MTSLRFRHVDASPTDDVTTWPYEAIVTAITRSGLTAAQFADLVGTSASRLSTDATGRVTPSAAMLVRIERLAGS